MLAIEIAPGDILLSSDNIQTLPVRTEYTVVSVDRVEVEGSNYVRALVRYTVDGGLSERHWLLSDEVPLVHPGPDVILADHGVEG